MNSDEAYTEILRKMTPQKKHDVMVAMYWSAREIKANWLRSIHPEWTEAQVQKTVRDAFLYAGD